MDSHPSPDRDPASISSWYRPTSGSVMDFGGAAGAGRKTVFTERAEGPGPGDGGDDIDGDAGALGVVELHPKLRTQNAAGHPKAAPREIRMTVFPMESSQR